MKPSGIEWIGDIPQEWEITALRRVSKIQTGNTPDKTNTEQYFSTEGGVPWIKAENLGLGTPIHNTSEYLSEEGVKYGRLFQPYTVYVCCIASVGKVGYSDITCSCNQQINGITFTGLYWKYGYYMTTAQEAEYINRASGNVIKILNTDKQSAIMCPIPIAEEQREIATYLDTKCAGVDRLIEKKQAILTELEQYKKSLIYEYVTGKKEIPGEKAEQI